MIKAIETKYKGYKFRSRLEARWAVFFDALGIKWEYEAEGYNMDGVYYLPDFYFPEKWAGFKHAEVKPEIKELHDNSRFENGFDIKSIDINKFKKFNENDGRCILLDGLPRQTLFFTWEKHERVLGENEPFQRDFVSIWMDYLFCGGDSSYWHKNGSYVCSGCTRSDIEDGYLGSVFEGFLSACEAAKQARF